MPYLDVALAFALTMLVLATLVSQIVNVAQKFTKLRSTEFRKMLREYFDKEIKPTIERELDRLKIIGDVSTGLSEAADGLKDTHVFDDYDLSTLTFVSTEDLKEKLKRSKFGKKILIELGDKAEDVFNEFGKRFEAVGRKFTWSFRENSRKWATGVALVLALTFNIDSVHIIKSYIENEVLRESVIARSDEFVQGFDKMVETLEKDKDKESVTKDEFLAKLKETREELNSFENIGFPIGWGNTPNVTFGGILAWILGILFTAGFAGLGAPFWRDAIVGISRVAQSKSKG